MEQSFDNKTVDQLRVELVEQADTIEAHIKALDDLERHIFPVTRITVEPRTEEPEPEQQSVEVEVGDEVRLTRSHPLKSYQKAHKIVDGADLVGYIARVRHGLWQSFSTDYQDLGLAPSKGKAMQFVANFDVNGTC